MSNEYKGMKEEMDEIRKRLIAIRINQRLTKNQKIAFGDMKRILNKIESGDIF